MSRHHVITGKEDRKIEVGVEKGGGVFIVRYNDEKDRLDTIVNTLGEGTFKGLLSYAMNRALESSADQARSVAKMKDWPVGGSDNDSEGDRDR